MTPIDTMLHSMVKYPRRADFYRSKIVHHLRTTDRPDFFIHHVIMFFADSNISGWPDYAEDILYQIPERFYNFITTFSDDEIGTLTEDYRFILLRTTARINRPWSLGVINHFEEKGVEEAIEAYGALGTPDALKRLEAIAEDSTQSEEVRTFAQETLGDCRSHG